MIGCKISSRKIDKYEYLTDEETLPPDQCGIIKQAKFTYSDLGKAFEKQIKAIENQGEKQIKAIEEHGKQLVKLNLTYKKNDSEKDAAVLLTQTKKTDRLISEKRDELQNLSRHFNCNDLTYHFKTKEIN